MIEFLSRSKEMESATLVTKLAVFVLLTVVAVSTIQRILRNTARGKDIKQTPKPYPLNETATLTQKCSGDNTPKCGHLWGVDHLARCDQRQNGHAIESTPLVGYDRL